MTPALEQIKALQELEKVVAEMRDSENSARFAPRPVMEVNMQGWADRIDTALQALRDETGGAVEQLAECFRLAGGDTECVSTPEGQARQAAEVVRDLRACYDEAIRPAPAAEAAPQGGKFIDLPPFLRRDCPDYGGLDDEVREALGEVNDAANRARRAGDYDRANALVKARVALYRAAAGQSPATPPSAPAVATDAQIAEWRERHSLGAMSATDARAAFEDAQTLLSAPVPQEGVDEALRIAYSHLDMTALRVSHCKDAAKIETALAAAPAQGVR